MPVYHNQNPLYSVNELATLVSLTPQSINKRISRYKESNNLETFGRTSKDDNRVWVYSDSEIRQVLEPKYYDRFQSNLNPEVSPQETPKAEIEVMPTVSHQVTSEIPSYLAVKSTQLATFQYSTEDLEDTLELASEQSNNSANHLSQIIKMYTRHKAEELKLKIDTTFAAIEANALGESLTDTVKSISQ